MFIIQFILKNGFNQNVINYCVWKNGSFALIGVISIGITRWNADRELHLSLHFNYVLRIEIGCYWIRQIRVSRRPTTRAS